MPYPPTSVWWIVEPKNATTRPLRKNGIEHGDVEQLAGRLVRVVGDQHVALDNESVGNSSRIARRGTRQGVDVAGGAGDRLGHHPTATVEPRVGGRRPPARSARTAGAATRGPVRIHRRDQALPQDLELDRVERLHGCPPMPLLLMPVPFQSAISEPSAATLTVQFGADHRRGLALFDDHRPDDLLADAEVGAPVTRRLVRFPARIEPTRRWPFATPCSEPTEDAGSTGWRRRTPTTAR